MAWCDVLAPSFAGIVTFVGGALLWNKRLGPLTAVPAPLAESVWALDGIILLEYLLLLPGFTPPPRSHVNWLSRLLGQADGPYIEMPEGAPYSPNHRMRELLVILFLARSKGSRNARYDLPMVVMGILTAYAWALAWQVHWLPLLCFISAATIVHSLAWWYIGDEVPGPSWRLWYWFRQSSSSNTEIALGVAAELIYGAASLVSWGAAFILKVILFGMAVFLSIYADFASSNLMRDWRQRAQLLRLQWRQWGQQQQHLWDEEQQRHEREQERIVRAFLARESREAVERLIQKQREREKEREAAASRRSPSPTKDAGGESLLCVVCMMEPRTVGLKHKSAVHLCLCKQCQRQAKITVGSPCVICRQRVEEVMHIYT